VPGEGELGAQDAFECRSPCPDRLLFQVLPGVRAQQVVEAIARLPGRVVPGSLQELRFNEPLQQVLGDTDRASSSAAAAQTLKSGPYSNPRSRNSRRSSPLRLW
jgi:hypothetical protein